MILVVIDDQGNQHEVLDDLGNKLCPDEWDFKRGPAREYLADAVARTVADIAIGAAAQAATEEEDG